LAMGYGPLAKLGPNGPSSNGLILVDCRDERCKGG
jgi:hypothetical protein